MKKLLTLLLLLLLTTGLLGVEIDTTTSNLSLLPKSKIFFDASSISTKEQLQESRFVANDKETLSYGFVPQSTLWIRVKLQNTTDEPLQKVLVYENSVTEFLTFYDSSSTLHDGMLQVTKDRQSIYPTLFLELAPHEERTILIEASSNFSTLIAQLSLYTPKDFYAADFKRKLVIFIFLTVLLTLLLYNFMLYLFTKERAYLYYVFYMFSLIFFQSFYLGVFQLYIFSHAMSVLVAKASLIYISVFILSILLFTREFLNIVRFKKIDAVFRFYFYATPLIALFGYNNFLYNMNAIIFFIPLGVVVIFAGFYTLFHGVKEAKFYVIGWSFVAISLVLTNLKTLGLFNIDIYFSYTNELAFSLEAFLFSIALAHKIKILTQEKKESDRKLNEELNTLVEERTRDLNIALASQELLYKELNHRVKNNLQMVASLIKLQMSSSHSMETKNALQTTYNRIHSIAELYEILNVQKLHASRDIQEYFMTIVENIKNNFDKDVDVEYEVDSSVALEKIIYLGLILNELVTNSFKHAFHESGSMKIRFVDEGGSYLFSVQDSGKAKEEDFNKHGSLGLMIVKTLVEKQLFATIKIDVTQGTTISIRWSEDAI